MLATTFANAWINVGFSTDKLITVDGGTEFIYRHKHHTLLSATATLGLVHLWDVDGGLVPIDKYLYSNDTWVSKMSFFAKKLRASFTK